MKRLLFLMSAMLSGLAAGAQCSASLTAVQSAYNNSLLNVNVTNTSSYGTPFTGQIKRYLLNYGDGSGPQMMYSNSSSHTYASPGTYNVGIRIYSIDTSTNAVICTDTTWLNLTVAYPACGTVLSASGTANSRSFTASNPAGTSGMSYSWSYGDGSTGTGSSVSHTYASSGIYTVTCVSTAGSPASCTYTNSFTVNIFVAPPPLTCGALSASFNAVVASGGSNVGFSNTSSTVSYPYMLNSYWDFGDGTTTQTYATSGTSHVYNAVGTYTVKLRTVWSDTFNTTTCRDSATKTVTITSVSPGALGGVIWPFDTAFYGQPSWKVWLIQFNPATNMLTAIDSQTAVYNFGYPNYQFNNVAGGNYLVKAARQGGPTTGTGLLPTYADSSLSWSTARSIPVTPGLNSWAAISPRVGTVTAGPGFVAGNVSLGANKGSGSGVAGLTMIVRDAANRPVQMAVTDASGNYSFSKLPAGTYKVYPELLNYAVLPATVTVGSGSTPVSGINFYQDDTKMNILPTNVGIKSVTAVASNWTMAPNPASGKVQISWTGVSGTDARVLVTDISGRIVLSAQLQTAAQGMQTIDLSNLQPGLYFVQCSGALSGGSQKLILR